MNLSSSYNNGLVSNAIEGIAFWVMQVVCGNMYVYYKYISMLGYTSPS